MGNDLSCPFCKQDFCVINLTLVTDWGYEYFKECTSCGIIFRDKERGE